MTTLARTAAAALAIGMSGLVYFAPTFASELSQISVLNNSVLNSTASDIGTLSASRKVRCIMPPAWRQACGA